MKEKMIEKMYSEYDDPDFLNKKSSTSTKVTDIQNMIFGGSHSRFWLLRKHFNSMTEE